MAEFRTDNTEGYTTAQLAELNCRFDAAMAEVDPEHPMIDDIRKSTAERMLEQFDTEHA